MKRYYDNDGNPLHEVCGNCKLRRWGTSESIPAMYCQRTRLIVKWEDSCIYHVSS
ncbi:MAG: hypothetical protein IJV08_11480 [Bacteroidaceae bacterium]|nr:hypothetical protein [Bacteroidaceae bacterium]MBR1449522.1 hypothetical protein [Prevotella sp.]